MFCHNRSQVVGLGTCMQQLMIQLPQLVIESGLINPTIHHSKGNVQPPFTLSIDLVQGDSHNCWELPWSVVSNPITWPMMPQYCRNSLKPLLSGHPLHLTRSLLSLRIRSNCPTCMLAPECSESIIILTLGIPQCH